MVLALLRLGRLLVAELLLLRLDLLAGLPLILGDVGSDRIVQHLPVLLIQIGVVHIGVAGWRAVLIHLLIENVVIDDLYLGGMELLDLRLLRVRVLVGDLL